MFRSLPACAKLSALLLGSLFFSRLGNAQGSSLTLASASATKGATVSLNLSLNTVSGSVPAGLQWTLGYAATDVATISAVAGPALTAVGKTLTCVTASGSLACLSTGTNSTSIGNGVVAVVSVTLSTNSGTLVSLPLSNILGVMPDGTFA